MRADAAVAAVFGPALDTVHRHPRHLLLAACVAGLVAGRLGEAAVLAGMLAVAILGRTPRHGLMAAIAVMGGAVWSDTRGHALDTGPLTSRIGSSWSGRVVVLEPPRLRSHGRSVVRVQLLDGSLGDARALARLAAQGAEGARPASWLEPGQVLAVSGRVEELTHWETFERRSGALAALQVHRWKRTPDARTGIAGLLDRIRDRARTGVTGGLPEREAAVLRGMVLGEDQAIGHDVREAFRRSGLAHLLAVSGQNVMLLCLLVSAAGAVTGVALRARLAVALLLVLAYVPLTGAGPSIQRAGVMGAAGLVAALAGRPASRWYAVLLAAMVTLAFDPRAIEDPGWQLSFAAVIGLLAAARPCSDGLRQLGCPRPLADATAVTAVATLATAPLLAHHFETVSVVSLPANLAAAPAVAPVMWLGMIAVAAAQVHPAVAVPFAWLSGPLVAYVEGVAGVASRLEGATVPASLSWPLGVVLAYVAMGGAYALAHLGRRGLLGRGPSAREDGPSTALRRLAAAVAVAAVVAVLAAGPLRSVLQGERPPDLAGGELLVSFLDVGQGDATLIQTDGAALLFDTGTEDGPILRRLREAGVGRLDVLVLTHAQADHEGAALEVIDAFRPRLVLNGGTGWPSPVQSRLEAAVRATRGRLVAARSDQRMRLDGIGIHTLWPPPLGDAGPSGDPNQRALVAHLEHGDFDLLLPADAESDVLAQLELPRVDALKVSHHGSEDPGLPAVLDRLRPTVAAIEVGRGNSYGHPAPSTLAALKAVDELARTDRDGTVRLRVRSDGGMELRR